MKTIVAITLLAAAFAVAGCNTVRGMGEDIQKAGSSIEKAADKNK